MYKSRQQQLEKILQEQQIDGLALNAGPSLTYLTGLHFHLSERPVVLLLIPGRTPAVILPELEQAKLSDTSYLGYVYPENPNGWPEVFRRACRDLKLDRMRLGIEPNQMRVLEHTLLQNGTKTCTFMDISGPLSKLRSIKDDGELARMRHAVSIAEKALSETLNIIGPGITEKEVASELVLQLFRHGSDPALPFSPIVATGPNGANPHGVPSARKLAPGDLLIIDWGAAHAGYVSDLTRTFGIEEVSEAHREIHAIVRRANSAGLEAARPGEPCSSVDRAARSVIEQAGYGACFTHRTGHGLGMECHEHPYIRDDNDQLLLPGMTFTIEPGIYLTGENGVRIEDDVVITDNGAESLSSLTRDLILIG